MNCLSRTAASAAAIVMLLMARPSLAADDQVHLQPIAPNTRSVVGPPVAQYGPAMPGYSNWRPHRYAIFWRGYCLCESICWEAKLQRYRYPDYLRHQRYVAAHHASGGYGPPMGQLAPGGQHCEHGGPRTVSSGWRGWLPNLVSLGRRRRVISVQDTVVAGGPKTSRPQALGHGTQDLSLGKQGETDQSHETGAPLAGEALDEDSDGDSAWDENNDFLPDTMGQTDDVISPEPLDATTSDQRQCPVVLSAPGQDEPSRTAISPETSRDTHRMRLRPASGKISNSNSRHGSSPSSPGPSATYVSFRQLFK